ncbi:MAG: ABC transporter ATP-binding protein [Candidatus Sumerlaeia bacterium]|nr:ABC transporter ATP-binding protein [Candidatus Sumerlaeia bacterium]
MAKKPRPTMQERREQFRRALPEALALARPYRGMLAFALVLLLVNRAASLVLPAAPKFIFDDALAKGDTRFFYQIVAAVVAASFIQGASIFLMTQTVSKAGQRLIRDLRVKIHGHVSRLPLRYFDSHRSGEVTSRVMNDVEGVRNLLGTGIVELLNGALTFLFVVPILFWLNWKLTLVALSFLGFFGILMVFAFKKLRPIFEERQEAMGVVTGRLTESFGGIRVVKAYTTEGAEQTVFAAGANRLLDVILRTIGIIAFLALTTSGLTGLLGAAVLLVGGHQIMAGEFQPGAFISYIFYVGFMIAPVAQAVSIAGSLSEAFAGLDRMRQVLGEEREDTGDDARAPLGPVEGRVEFRGVSFSYEAGKQVLHTVSFDAEPGTSTALVGPSGGGKSTVIGLLAGFYRPQEGAVLVDGRDLATVRLADYRRQLGVVLQENFLFDGTVAENIRYARPEASDEALHEAARLAHCGEFIEKLPQGWDTIVGERGVKLSGGQRQRVAIARAILANPRILILDEATSSLDSESEAYIQDGLRTLMKGRTTFIIAHRLSTIRAADQILVLEGGRIVERGAHAALLAAKGRYHDMYTLQHGLDGRFGPGSDAENRAVGVPGDTSERPRQRGGFGSILA